MANFKETVEIYDQIVAKCDEITRKGKSVPYTSDNGYMYSLVNKEGELGFRLPKAEQEAFKQKFDSTIFKSHGATMKDYVLIPEALFSDLDLLAGYLKQGQEFVMSLPPK